MSDIRKWLKIMESVPAIFPDQDPKHSLIKQDATVMIDPSVGGGTARYMNSTPDGAMVDIKGIARELSQDDFSLPERDYEDGYRKGNDWFHMSVNPDTPGTMNDKPEFRAGDMVKVADVYGTAIGPGMGVFVAYGTTGQDCIISFDNKEIIIPVANIAAALEQNAKDNFDEMDNDGNLSPMSFGAKNIKVEEPAMDQRDEFSRWMSAVEEALQGTSKPALSELAEQECNCKKWNCQICFPDDKDSDVEVEGMPLVDEEHNKFSTRSGNKVQIGDLKIKMDTEIDDGHNSPETYGKDNLLAQPRPDRQYDDVEPAASSLNPEHSPLTDVEEEVPMDADPDDYGKAGRYSQEHFGNLDEFHETGVDQDEVVTTQLGNEPEDEEVSQEMVDKILNIQAMGFSKDDRHYTREELLQYTPEEMQACYDRVMGDVAEAHNDIAEPPDRPRPTKTKQVDPFADMGDDILNPPKPNLPAGLSGSDDTGFSDQGKSMNLPTSSRADTLRKVGAISPSDQMRDFMNRINPMAGGEEPELPPVQQDQVVVRTAADVPAVISSAMQAAGMQNPEWHTVDNLPGYTQRNIRGMGRQIFSMFTSTPLENIQTLANVNGQGPNTDAEMRAVAGWLRDNAEDLGRADVSHGMAIPGYEPDVKEYRANGVRFQVVRDPMGQYIYAYPDKDARLGGPPAGQDQLPGERMPRLRESYDKPTLIEQLKYDEEIRLAFLEAEMSEAFGKPSSKERRERSEQGYKDRLGQWQYNKTRAGITGEPFDDEEPKPPMDKKPVARRLAGKKGGHALLDFLHKKHLMSNFAEMDPIPFDMNVLWEQFKSNPDNFVIIDAQDGVAGIKPNKEAYDAYVANKLKKGEVPNPGGNSSLPYQIIAFKNNGTRVPPEKLRDPKEKEHPDDPTIQKTRMGLNYGVDRQNMNNAMHYLKNEIGEFNTLWLSGFGGLRGAPETLKPAVGSIEREKLAKRAEMKKSTELSSGEAVNKIFTKIRPVLKTVTNQALSQIHRRAQRYLEGGNFEAAQKVAASGQKLKQLLVSIDTNAPVAIDTGYGSKTMELSSAISKAIAQASGSPVGTDAYNKYASSVAQGGVAELRPILDELRNALVGL